MFKLWFFSLCCAVGICIPSQADVSSDAGILKSKIHTLANKNKICILIEGDPLSKYHVNANEINSAEDFAKKFHYSLSAKGRVILLKKTYDDCLDFPVVSNRELLNMVKSLTQVVDKYSSWAPGKGFSDSWRGAVVDNDPELIKKMMQQPVSLAELSPQSQNMFQRVLLSQECTRYYDLESIRKPLNKFDELAISSRRLLQNFDGFSFVLEEDKFVRPFLKRDIFIDMIVGQNKELSSEGVQTLPMCENLIGVLKRKQLHSAGTKLLIAPELEERSVFIAGENNISSESLMRSLAELGGLKMEKANEYIKIRSKQAERITGIQNFRQYIMSIIPDPLLRYAGYYTVEEASPRLPGYIPMVKYRSSQEMDQTCYAILSKDLLKSIVQNKKDFKVAECTNREKCALILMMMSESTRKSVVDSGKKMYSATYASDIFNIFFKVVPEDETRLILEVHGPPVNGSTLRMGFGGLPRPR